MKKTRKQCNKSKKSFFLVKWFHFQDCLNIYAYQNTSQSLCRRIFRHFFDREIAMIFFSQVYQFISHNYHLNKTRCYRQHNYTMYHIQ
jgi:hypothetical protein